jgi:predicted N-formylglutamate amidohydrolase
VITCEHASNEVPPPLAVSASDRGFLRSHWGWDIGAEEVAREVADRTGAMAVFARFSRLVCDLNRPPEHPTWILTEIDGRPISFNRDLDLRERERRRRVCHRAYHGAVDGVLARCCDGAPSKPLLLSVHSFTPELYGEIRRMEIGVLFSDHEDLARRMAELLAAEGFRTALNEPYSGLDGLAYAAQVHGRAHAVPFLELEIRQDLIATAEEAKAIAARVSRALLRLLG